jgi:hypothetical protein
MELCDETVEAVVQVFEQCLAGEVAESNALPQLLHLYRGNSRSVLAALSEKANFVVANADAGPAAGRAARVEPPLDGSGGGCHGELLQRGDAQQPRGGLGL